jgi:LysM repeat protein
MKRFYLLTLVIASAIFVNAQTGLMIKNDEKGLYLEHTVAAKEGLYAIGRLYNASPKHIAGYNKIDLNGSLNIGQILRIPLTDTNFTQKSTAGTPVYYTVGASDGLLKVSNEHKKVSIKNLKEWNNLSSDNIQEGANLVVGFLISKEMTAQRANELAKKPETAKTTPVVIYETAITQEKATDNKERVQILNTEGEMPEETKKEEAKKTEPKKPASTEVAPGKEESKPATVINTSVTTPSAPVNAVVREEVNPAAVEGNGYFKASFEQQVKGKAPHKNSTVTSGVFKTTSGWQDAKYYLLIDNITPGTIVKVINPDNNKAVYAKVLGEMNGIRQNEGLDIRISNAAASALQISESDKFIVNVSY